MEWSGIMFTKEGRALFNDGWQFKLVGHDDLGVPAWSPVELPHDWLIHDSHNLYKSGVGEYRRDLFINRDDMNKSVELYFDGVYMDCQVYVNGEIAGQHKYGYTAFYLEISGFLHEGGNEILVRVNYESPNSRWYSGAGIYRNVWLIKQNKTHIISDGVYIHVSDEGEVTVQAECVGDYDELRHTTFGELQRWTLENPVLYEMKTELIKNGEVVDCVYNRFGFRTVEFDRDRGFLLNGERVKLQGVCQHHDLGAFGAAVNVNAIRRQLELLKSMGVNAVRTAHNPPCAEYIELCDEMGLLVINELTDVWELSKNKYDYARFFPQWYRHDVKSWVCRDRNHPCVIMWSIGNEIYDTHACEKGMEIAQNLYNEVLRYDSRVNAGVTIGSNFMMSENARRISDFLRIAGYNYGEHFYDEQREMYPNMFIYGSETTSTVRSRGIYHFPIEVPLLTHEDNQCSDLGNSVVGWGRTNESAHMMDISREWCGGQFIWTGTDYIGEPTPYSTKNSYFGAIDTAGLFKASYYFYRSVWNKKALPFVKIFPHWDWNEGQLIDVIVYSNMARVELFLNGRLLETRRVKYEPGELIAKAYDEQGELVATDRQASFGEVAGLRVTTEVYGDLSYHTISAVDKDGNFVANARNRVKVTGEPLLGLDNGDSTDYDSYKSDNRRLFSGQLVAISHGEITAELDNSEILARKIELSADRRELDSVNPTARLTARILPANADYRDVVFRCVSDNGLVTNIADVFPERAGEYESVLHAKITAKGDGNFRVTAMLKNGGRFPQVISELEMSVSGMGVITRAMDSFATFTAASCDRVYGDSYKITDDKIEGIGNNVVLEFHGMDFGAAGTSRLTICGSTPLSENNTIRINFGDTEQLIEFAGEYCYNEQTFDIKPLTGQGDISFTFLPGSCFNFGWFKFN
jgi:beta-galactosidase